MIDGLQAEVAAADRLNKVMWGWLQDAHFRHPETGRIGPKGVIWLDTAQFPIDLKQTTLEKMDR